MPRSWKPVWKHFNLLNFSCHFGMYCRWCLPTWITWWKLYWILNYVQEQSLEMLIQLLLLLWSEHYSLCEVGSLVRTCLIAFYSFHIQSILLEKICWKLQRLDLNQLFFVAAFCCITYCTERKRWVYLLKVVGIFRSPIRFYGKILQK